MARSVLLVDDLTELRSALRQALESRGGFTVVAEAENGATAIVAAARHQPEVMVLDLGLPDLAGHEVLTRLRVVSPSAQIVVYTGAIGSETSALTGQVEAFVTKDNDVRYLVDLLSRLSWPHYETARIDLGPAASDVGVARRFVSERCGDWGCADLVDDAELVVSELVTNALVHGATRCELRAGLSDAALRLQVVDLGWGIPDPQSARESDEHGRGLVLVSTLCAAWGVEALPGGGKVVWAELLRPLGDPGGPNPAGDFRADVRERRHQPGPATWGTPASEPPAGAAAPTAATEAGGVASTARSRRPAGRGPARSRAARAGVR